MNKYKLFFTCAASLLLMSSCYDLDRYPEDQLSAGTFFQTQEHADQAMMGVYSQMTHNDVFGRQFGFDCLGGVGAGYDAPSYPNIGRGTYTTTEGAVGDKFKQLYEGVTRANIVLQNVDQCDMSDELKTRYNRKPVLCVPSTISPYSIFGVEFRFMMRQLSLRKTSPIC